VGGVELEWWKIIIWWRCAISHKSDHTIVIGFVDAMTTTRLTHFGFLC